MTGVRYHCLTPGVIGGISAEACAARRRHFPNDHMVQTYCANCGRVPIDSHDTTGHTAGIVPAVEPEPEPMALAHPLEPRDDGPSLLEDLETLALVLRRVIPKIRDYNRTLKALARVLREESCE